MTLKKKSECIQLILNLAVYKIFNKQNVIEKRLSVLFGGNSEKF